MRIRYCFVKVRGGYSAFVRLTSNDGRSLLHSTGGDELFLPFIHATALGFFHKRRLQSIAKSNEAGTN